MWTEYEVTFNFLTKLVGSTPADSELIKKWTDARRPSNRPPNTRSLDEIAEEVINSLPEEPTPGVLVFQRQEGGLVVRMSTIRAHIKDCARILSSLYVGKIQGEKSFAVRILNSLYYPPEIYWLPILGQDNNRQFHEPSGTYDKAVHGQVRGLPTNSLKSMEYVNDARLTFALKVLTTIKGKPVVSLEDLNTLFEYGGIKGYGGERGDGEGKYVAHITAK